MTGTIVDITVPAAQFALEYTLGEFEGVAFEVEQVAATNHDSLMPFMRIETTHRIQLQEAFAADDSVADFERIAAFETECLYKLDWADRIDHLIRMLVDQNATIQTATGHTDCWDIRLLFDDRETAAAHMNTAKSRASTSRW
ncbi:bacterio-opsin activator domain-containing protein [Haladaptatus pallidirubidus]|uniref:bacterio-opsin activator domain-containing protein n=1 Tax=Haladaptatus pallidirubidus TaxID=1008152 RepID=UPI0035EEB9AC